LSGCCESRLKNGIAQPLRAGEVGGDLCLGDADQRQAAVGFCDDAVLFGAGRERDNEKPMCASPKSG
jgi:hypothetical protein